MAYVITTKEDNRILAIGRVMDYMENGYPRLVEQDVAFPDKLVYVNGETTNGVDIPESLEIPAGVKPEEWCYTKDKGFYENTGEIDYNAPVPEAEVVEEPAEAEPAEEPADEQTEDAVENPVENSDEPEEPVENSETEEE